MINLSYDQQIKEWIQNHRDEILQEWIEISKTPAIKGEAEENAPFGKECAKSLDECAQLFKKHGFDTKVYADSGYALSNFGKGEKTIGLFGHSDVVPVGEDWLYTRPFEPIIKDGTLIGRGVWDNKSGIMAALCAMEIIRDCNIPVKSKLLAFIGSEEETGMTDIMAFAKEQPMPDASLILDAEFPCSIGEKGIYHFWAGCNKRTSDILDFCGGEAFNVVLDKATVVLKSSDIIKTELTEKIKGNTAFSLNSEKDTLILTAKSIAKHASEPEGSVNAAYLISSLLCELDTLSDNDKIIMHQISTILSCPFGTSMGLDHDDIRFGKLTFVNGIVSMTDGHISLSFDTRYGSTLAPEVLENNVNNSFGKLSWSVKPVDNKNGFSIPDDSPIPAVLEGIYNEITGLDEKVFRLGGGTYARLLENAFSVGTCTTRKDRETPFMTMPPGHGGAHQCDEMIDIEGFFDALRIITHYIINMDECI